MRKIFYIYASVMILWTSCEEKQAKTTQTETPQQTEVQTYHEPKTPGGNAPENQKVGKKQATTFKTRAKLVKKWTIVYNYWVSSKEYPQNQKYFLDLKEDGSYHLKTILEDEEINENGTWKFKEPKPTLRVFEGTSEENGVSVADYQEVIVLTTRKNAKIKERTFLFEVSEGKASFNQFTRPSGFEVK